MTLTERTTPYLLAIVLAGCGSVAAATDGGGDQGDAGPTPDAPGPEWIVEATDPDSLGSFFHAVGLDGRIYYSRDGMDATRFFRHYDLSNGMMIDDPVMPDPENDLCACGYGSDLVAGNGSGQIHYFANYGHLFDRFSSAWITQDYPAAFQRGEAAVARINDFIYFVGGRGPLNTSQAWDTINLVWDATTPPSYVAAVEDAKGAAVAGRMYVLGGRNGAAPVQLFASWGPGEGSWTLHPDLPEQFPEAAVGFRGEVWALFGSHFRRFDPSTNVWGTATLDLPTTVSRGIPVVVVDPTSGEETLYFVDAATAGTRFIRYNR